MFQIGKEPLENGMNILGAHIDSPRIDVKQNPLYENEDLAYLDTHYYGGIKKYQWVTLPLAMHGVIAKKDGSVVTIIIGEKPEEVVKQNTENYISEYRRDLEPMYTEDEKDKEDESSIGAWYSYYKGIVSHVQLYDKDLLVYRIDYNEYTGGAHGIYMATYLNMDLTLMRPLRLDDIFVGDYKDALTDLIWNQLMADNKVTTHEALEDMGYASTGDITPTENFYLSKEGVTFYYNVYDITPYSMGPVKVTIPFAMMEHLLGSNPILGELKN